MNSPSVLVVGHVFVDVFLPSLAVPNYTVRLGGILHAARALAAAGSRFGLAFIAPEYLKDTIHRYATALGAIGAQPVGVIRGSPNVMLIADPQEVGQQGYADLLRESRKVDLCPESLTDILRAGWDQALVFPSPSDVELFRDFQQAENPPELHADVNFLDVDAWRQLIDAGVRLRTIILSTSSGAFLKDLAGSSEQFWAEATRFGGAALLKENRGGARYLAAEGETPQLGVSFLRSVRHSVGVGDCFNAALVTRIIGFQPRAALAAAAGIAAEYAATVDYDQFVAAAQPWFEMSEAELCELQGVSLPWEQRRDIHVYIAAPDFDFVNTVHIDAVVDSLTYHNFAPRRPVRESGQMESGASPSRRQELCDADLRILDECQLVVAVLLYDDPGTLVEVGIAVERGLPVVLYDPYRKVDNLMLTQLAHRVVHKLDDVVVSVFEIANNQLRQ